MKYVILIDGYFLEKNIQLKFKLEKTELTIYYIRNFCRFIFNHKGNDDVSKIYYYDSLPIITNELQNPINSNYNSYNEFEYKYYNFKSSLFNNIENIRDERDPEGKNNIFVVKLGYTTATNWEVKKNFLVDGHKIQASSVIPKYSQKLVDILLSMDLILLSQTKEIEIIFIVTNDSDFYPAIEQALKLNTKVILVTFSNVNISKKLKNIVTDILIY